VEPHQERSPDQGIRREALGEWEHLSPNLKLHASGLNGSAGVVGHIAIIIKNNWVTCGVLRGENTFSGSS